MPVWASKLCCPNNTFQALFFQLYFNKKYVEVAITKIRQKRKTMRQKDIETKEEICESIFIYLKYIIDHKNVRFFSLISLQTCSKSSNEEECFVM